MKCKIFYENDFEYLQDEVNKFIKDKRVVRTNQSIDTNSNVVLTIWYEDKE